MYSRVWLRVSKVCAHQTSTTTTTMIMMTTVVTHVNFGRKREARFYVFGIRKQEQTAAFIRVWEAAVTAVVNC